MGELIGPIMVAPVAPATAALNDLWQDTSQVPPVLKYCTSASPVTFAPMNVVSYAAKQDGLVSGTTLKTVNGTALLGSGNLATGGGAAADIPLTLRAPTTDQVIPSGYSAYVVGPYEIRAGVSLDIQGDACLEIG